MVLPSRIHAVVLVSKLHKPTLRALAFARATHPDTLTALTVSTNDADVRELQRQWADRDVPVPLTVLESKYRDITGPVLDYVASQSAGTDRATSSSSTCRSTSSATGGSTCCTTRARCG